MIDINLIDFIGNRELEGLRLSNLSWWSADGGKATISTPPKGDFWGPAAPTPPPLLLPIKFNVLVIPMPVLKSELRHVFVLLFQLPVARI